MAQNIVDLFEDKARNGEGQFAIAFALARLAEAHERLAVNVGYLGFNAPDGRSPGTLEQIGMQLRSIASALDHLTVSASVDVSHVGDV